MQTLTGVMSTVYNPALFTAKIETKIFNKFPLETTFNRMVNKVYYDGNLSLHKFKCAVQGQQTLLFVNDLNSFVERLVTFVDISQSLDPRKKFLPYYIGLDRVRNKNHGKFKFSITKSYIEVYPRRRINRYTNRLVIELFDFEYG